MLEPNWNYLIKGKSIIIKPITLSEISDKYVSWLNDKELNEFLEIRHSKQNKKTIVSYINSLRKRANCDMLAIFNKKDNLHIGNLTITSYNSNNNQSVDFGLMIADESARAKGVGAIAHIMFLKFIFSFHEINRINANVASENIIASRTLESIGYVKEGVRRECFPLANGTKCDVLYYGILKREWLNKQDKLSIFLKNIEFKKNESRCN